jgi:hypothetical protein
MNRLWGVLIAAVAVVGIAAAGFVAVADSDDEDEREFKARLNGYQETPAVFSTGKGRFEAQLSADGTTLSYTLTYSGLEGATTTAAHIHFGQKNVAGGVAAFLCGGGGKPACPNTAGTVSGTVVAADVIGPAAQGIAAGEFGELLTAMEDGMTYANVHTNKHPGGEIRGHIG